MLKGSWTNRIPWSGPPALSAIATTSSRERCWGSPGGTRKQSQVGQPVVPYAALPPLRLVPLHYLVQAAVQILARHTLLALDLRCVGTAGPRTPCPGCPGCGAADPPERTRSCSGNPQICLRPLSPPLHVLLPDVLPKVGWHVPVGCHVAAFGGHEQPLPGRCTILHHFGYGPSQRPLGLLER